MSQEQYYELNKGEWVIKAECLIKEISRTNVGTESLTRRDRTDECRADFQQIRAEVKERNMLFASVKNIRAVAMTGVDSALSKTVNRNEGKMINMTKRAPVVHKKTLLNRMTAAEYNKTSSNRLRAISIPYSDLVKALGEPHKNGEPDFPDDDCKVDVCWGVKSAEDKNNIVLIWNYKNGPVSTCNGTIEDIDCYSVYYNDEAFFNKLSKIIKLTPERIFV